MGKRTKKLTLQRALKLLQIEYGSQVKEVNKVKGLYYASEICGSIRKFTREDILKIEDEMYAGFGF